MSPSFSRRIYCNWHLCSLSAPVVDTIQAASALWLDRYLGIADVLSILDWMVTHVPQQDTPFALAALYQQFKSTSVAAIARDGAWWTPFVPVSPDTNTMVREGLAAIAPLSHRVPA